jgi:hypothetical protein
MKTAYQYTLVTPVAVREFASMRALKTWALENLGAAPDDGAGRYPYHWSAFPQWRRPFAFPVTGRSVRYSHEMPLYGRVYGTGRTVAAIAFRRPQEQP